jgi:hypothetical protein
MELQAKQRLEARASWYMLHTTASEISNLANKIQDFISEEDSVNAIRCFKKIIELAQEIAKD